MKRRAFLIGAGAALTAPRAVGLDIKDNRLVALSGDRFVKGDMEYRLADVTGPPLYTLGDKASVHFSQSKAALQSLLDTQAVTLDVTGETDRWGVKSVIAAMHDQTDLAIALVQSGAVRVRPLSEDLQRLDKLLMFEDAARREARGLWAHDAYRVRQANNIDDASTAIDAYHLLEGVVRRAASARSRLYLNFGDDYRTDFTISVRNRLTRKWVRDGFDLAGLTDKRLRVRGFVQSVNGPSVELTHIKQVESLDDADLL